VRLYTWEPDDPLADVFLMQFGDYPSADEIHVSYRDILGYAAQALEVKLAPVQNLPADIFQFPSIRSVSRSGLERHYGVHPGWDTPGFFSGDAGNFDDLVCYWNLRASDLPLLFVDPKHLGRYGETVASWAKTMLNMVSHRRHTFDRVVAVWVRREALDNSAEAMAKILAPSGGQASMVCPISADSWDGVNVGAPMMCWPEVSTLGVMGTATGRPKISFALDHKPFCGDSWFHTQHLVASLSFVGGLYGDEQHTLSPPFLPELNEFYARTMHFEYDKLRSESDRLGLIIDASDESSFIDAMPVTDLIEHVFELAGFSSKLSAAGLIARQLITQLGGVDGARAFKIPGVRRLLKTHGPAAPFTKEGALQLIGGRDPDNPSATFKDFEHLFIEPRPPQH
jgi:hypothetical protein